MARKKKQLVWIAKTKARAAGEQRSHTSRTHLSAALDPGHPVQSATEFLRFVLNTRFLF